MNIQVTFEKDHSIKNVSIEGNTILDLLNQLSINPETVLVVKNNEVLTEHEILSENDCLELLSVISGG